MAYPHNVQSTPKTTIITLRGDNADGDANVAINVPPGFKLMAAHLSTTGTATGTSFSFKPYINKAQSAAGATIAMAEPDDTSQITSITLAAGTAGALVHFLPMTVLFLGVGLHVVYGVQAAVNITGAAGDWEIVAICAEGVN